jgi:hypothetical protein
MNVIANFYLGKMKIRTMLWHELKPIIWLPVKPRFICLNEEKYQRVEKLEFKLVGYEQIGPDIYTAIYYHDSEDKNLCLKGEKNESTSKKTN